MKRLLPFLALLLFFTACTRSDDATAYSPLDYDGIDVSRHQGKIRWRHVAKNKQLRFVYVKATEGSTLVDAHFRRNIRKARRKQLKVGAYHFLTSTSSVFTQFVHFQETVRRHRTDLLPMIDVEQSGIRGRWTKAQLQDSLRIFVEMVRTFYGRPPVLYSGMNFYNENLAPAFNDCPLFLARYSTREPVVTQGSYLLWQYSETGRVRGIDGNVDLNRIAAGRNLNSLLR